MPKNTKLILKGSYSLKKIEVFNGRKDTGVCTRFHIAKNLNHRPSLQGGAVPAPLLGQHCFIFNRKTFWR